MKPRRAHKARPNRRHMGLRYLPAAAIVIFAAVLLKNAWLSDDAYITFRSVDNFVSGYGLVYNVGERVQSYTHPLWMLSLSLIHFATREFYYTTIIFSVVITLGTVHFFFKLSTRAAALSGLVVLLASKAFVDYSTSGLENPLSHLLVVVFLCYLFGAKARKATPLLLATIAAVAALNRLDTLAIYLPVLTLIAAQIGWKRSLPVILFGLSPLFVWTFFSLLYYGAAVANPAYSKLATGIPAGALMQQGLFYYLNSLTQDPLTLVAITAACVTVSIRRDVRELAVMAGVLLYLFYIVRVGGDFMSGRFFSVPLTASAVLLARGMADAGRRRFVIFYVAVAALAMLSARSHLLSGPGYGDVPLVQTRFFGPLPLSLIDEHGISDERAFYYQATGLLRPGGGSVPDHQWVSQGLDASRAGARVHEFYTLGFTGFYAGRGVHVIDPNGLNDFLIARLPIAKYSRWRIGHFTRKIPEGYTDSVSSGHNVITDPGLARYYDIATLITRGDLFAEGRMTAIWKINTGVYDHLIDSYMRNAEQ
ncbi:MAG: hypothetical protein OEN01_09975 [Candidatus Krumholzibacteria bacterium]|nr:hypothetical protein [Candidatus Krumholzibacteria bacterium]